MTLITSLCEQVDFGPNSRILDLGASRKKAAKYQFAIAQKPATMLRKEALSPNSTMATTCKHPKVRIVSRQDDIEFVECLECGEIFDSDEFRDMELEDSAERERQEEDA
jgi:Zn ribbon nucleic-acid-binding protein